MLLANQTEGLSALLAQVEARFLRRKPGWCHAPPISTSPERAQEINRSKYKMSQSLSQIWIHIIFSTKERYPFFKELSIQKRVHDYIRILCQKQNSDLSIVGGTDDHVHILTKLHKNISLSKLIEEIKISSSKWIKTLANQENELDRFYWQSGYGAFSVSQSNLERVSLYINNQYQHHQKQIFQDELREFLNRYEIKYDEKYLWD
jgi:REP element-mobilizing transposase RayT